MGKVGFSPHVISKSGSLHSSTIRWQTLAISVRTSNTTRSMLCRIARSPRGAPLDQLSHHKQQQHERRDHGGKDKLFERAHPPHGRHSCSSSRFYRFPQRGKLLLRRLALLV